MTRAVDAYLEARENKARALLRDRQVSYQHALGGAPGQAVLEDLARFCRAGETTFHPDPRVHALLEGRREVWLRVREFLDLEPEELMRRKTNVHE